MSDANLTYLAYQKETTWGVAPAVIDLKKMRFTKEALKHAKQTVQSAEIRDDRQITELTEVGVQAEGTIDFEFSNVDFDWLLEAFMFAAWSGAGAGTFLRNGVTRFSYLFERKAAAAAFHQFYGMMANELTLNITSRQIITGTAGFIGYLGGHSQGSLDATKATGYLTFAGNAVAGETVTIGTRVYTWATTPTTVANQVKVGASAAISLTNLIAAINLTAGAGSLYGSLTTINDQVTAFDDVGDMMKITAIQAGTEAHAIVTTETMTNASWGGGVMSGGVAATVTAPGTGKIFTASVNVAAVTEGGAALTSAIKSLKLNINNNLRGNDAVGKKGLDEVGLGECTITGEMQCYFRDNALFQKFFDHTNSSLVFDVTFNNAGVTTGYRFTLPAISFSDANPNVPGKNSDVMIPLNFQAVAAPGAYLMEILRIP